MANRTSPVELDDDDDDDDPLFVKDGSPVKFCFHRSVTQGRGRITRDVERHGGCIVRNERHANVLLVDEQEDLAFIRRRYYSSTERYRLSIYVEPRGFVQACIRSGTYCHVRSAKRRMPGRTPGRGGGGRRRVAFTEEDRDHLAYYLATRCPTKDGRMGNSAYKDLEQLGQTDDPVWAWARRHTFHSWREHYKMNPVMMDARIDLHIDRLKDTGHHFGHDPRRHDHRRREEEEGEYIEDEDEEEDEEEEEEEEPQQERQDNERRARDYLAHHERDLVNLEEEEGEGTQEEEEEAIADLQRSKRRAQHLHDVQQAKRVRGRREPDVESGRGESSPARETESENEESQSIEGSDLFGDRTYGDESDDSHEMDFPRPFSMRASSVPEQDGAPLSTQATLIASPLAADKVPTSQPGPTPTKSVKRDAPVPQPTPPSSQSTSDTTQERVAVQRARVRGGSAQPGSSVPKGTRTPSIAVGADAPCRVARARSRSVDEPQHAREQTQGGGKGKAKVTEGTLIPIKEDVRVEQEPWPREAHTEDVTSVAVSNGPSTRETFEDEMAVEGLLRASRASPGVFDEDEDDVDSDEDDVDDSGMPELPPFQEVPMESEPTDSDDAETHESLVRGAVHGGSVSGGDSDAESDQSRDPKQELDVGEGDQDPGQKQEYRDRDQNEVKVEDSDDADAERIERMARASLRAVLVPVKVEPRFTRSMAAAQARTQTRQGSPRWTRSRTQAHPIVFPSPRTKARAVVDLFQEDEGDIPYAPPEGTRAAKLVRGRGKR